MSLIDKIRKARETIVEVDGAKFTIRRPTAAEQFDLLGGDEIDYLRVVQHCVVDWSLKEIDLISGGNPVAVPFDAELWAEYVSDRPDLWQPIFGAIADLIAAHRKKDEDAVKK